MIRVKLPDHLCTLAGADHEIELHIQGKPTQQNVLNALETRFPSLKGALRDPLTKKRRPFVRFFACGEDLSHQPPDLALPLAVANGEEPFLVIAAIAGG
ncbi:MAG: MoaD/ThiS family protein [Acidimicrobiaceae bacterium]|nr:MoaD/ThiS family protein [Acidimicrobiaceae bacterium]